MGRRQDAVAPAEEAVQLYRDLARDNPAFLPDLASALNNLGIRYSEVGRRQDAVAPAEEAVQLCRDLARDNPAFLPDLARALNNLGIRYSEVGRGQDAVAPAEEAVQLRRDLARDNPAFLPDLASALNNLGIRYGEVGRGQDAVAPAEEAVQLYRDLARDNPAFLPHLASALNNLGTRYSEAGSPEHAEAAWQETLSGISPLDAVFLLTNRAADADAGNPEAALWLAAALRHASDDRGLTAAIHEEARRHWAVAPAAFSSVWTQHTGQQAPVWLTVNADLLEAAEGWIATATCAEESDFLASHPELLDRSADEAVSEALLAVSEDDAQRYITLRVTARVDGVAAAYRPLLLTILAHEFAQADPDTQQVLLATRRENLLSGAVRDSINSLAEGDDAGAYRAQALLELAELGEHEAVLDALKAPAGFAAFLHDLASRPDPAALGLAATAALTVASTAEQAAAGLFYLAVTAAITGSPADAAETLAQARRLDPGQETTWIAELASIGPQHPAVLPLITALTQPVEPEGLEPPEPVEDTGRTDDDSY